jgi:hypothetical protein
MTMTKKRLLLIAAVLLTIIVTLFVPALLPPSPGVTLTKFNRIERGMTVAEVEEIVGRKGEVVRAFRAGLRLRWHEEAEETQLGDATLNGDWAVDDRSFAIIEFFNGRVTNKRWVTSDETFLAKLRRWLHLR